MKPKLLTLLLVAAIACASALPVSAQRTSRDANADVSTPDTSTMTIEELRERIVELEEENQDLRDENDRLRTRLEELSGSSRSGASQPEDTRQAEVLNLTVGETWDGDDWSITATYVEFSPSLVSSWDTNQARGVYVIVHLTVINQGVSPVAFPYDDLILMDADGRSYGNAGFDEMFNLVYSVMGAGGMHDPMQPGLSYNTGVIFDIPVTSTGLVLTTSNAVFRIELD